MSRRARQKNRPFIELGVLLERWRDFKYSSALAFCEAVKPSFSYSKYADFERGSALPTVANLMEIAEHLSQDPREALLIWNQVQMPTADLKSFFSRQNFQLDGRDEFPMRARGPYKILSSSIPASEFDNTWVFGPFERDAINKNLWLMDFFIRLAMIYPEPLTFDDMGFRDEESKARFIEEYLKAWIQQGRLKVDEDKVVLVQPHFHAPKNEDWQGIREAMLTLSLDQMRPSLTPAAIRNKKSHRTLTTRYLTEEQRVRFLDSLARLEQEFFSIPYTKDSSKKTYTLLTILAPRKVELPENITRPVIKKRSPFDDDAED